MWRPLRAAPNTGQMGVVYLIAFDRPIGHALHYRGWSGLPITRAWKLGLRSDSPRLAGRLRAHSRGRGARLPGVAAARDTGWTLVWFEPGDRNEERRRKNRGGHGSRRDCCLCAAGLPHGPLP